ncbi:hypothetical protein CDD80_2123 [Ophiocordyceps camponoti-rufipedis]|uniref:Uncharacterized protein n=1 Tax=Ophiocordyceps camponoti-rufipedis TaxID=2004952 RepID=A0A2C5YSQ9_9HYPO|nr:hypothetical protein CDD80_2123 [Ophiocordyceps camponoti-rufipedis]
MDSSAVADFGHKDESEQLLGDSATAVSLSGLSTSDQDSTGNVNSSTCDNDDDNCSVSTDIHHDISGKADSDFETLPQTFNQQDETNSLLHHPSAQAASAASISPKSKKTYGTLSLLHLPKALPKTPIPDAEGINQ